MTATSTSGGDAGWSVAVDVGGSSIKGALVDGDGALSHVRRVPVAGLAAGALVPTILDTVEGLMGEAGAAGRGPRAVGLAVPGIVDEGAGIARSSMILGWHEVPFRALLLPLGLPVAFGHDVSSGAYAEASRGSAVGQSDWLFLALGTGLGATFVLRGTPYRGAGNRGGELAHVVVRPDGPECRCGKRGCAEMLASAEAVAASYNRKQPDTPVSGALAVAQRMNGGDPIAAGVWTEAVAALADAVACYVESLDPAVVVVGGGLAESGDLLLVPLRAALAERVRYVSPPPPLRPATFGQDAGLVGIGLAALDAAAKDRSWGRPFALFG